MTVDIPEIDVSVQHLGSFAEFRPIHCLSLYGEYQGPGHSCMEQEMKDFHVLFGMGSWSRAHIKCRWT